MAFTAPVGAYKMLRDDQTRRDLGLLDEATALACAFLESRGLRLGVEFHIEDAVAVACELIGAEE